MGHLKLLLGRCNVLVSKNEKITGSEMIAVNKHWSDRATVIRELGSKLLQQGYVRPGFIESALEREELGPTCLQGGLAIPTPIRSMSTGPVWPWPPWLSLWSGGGYR